VLITRGWDGDFTVLPPVFWNVLREEVPFFEVGGLFPCNGSGAHNCRARGGAHFGEAGGGGEVGAKSVWYGQGGSGSHAGEGLEEAAIVDVSAEFARGDGKDVAGELR